MQCLEEKVRFLAAEMLIILSDKLNASQLVVNHVVNSVDKIFVDVLNLVQKRLTDKCADEGGVLSLDDITEVTNELIECSVFDGLKSPDELLAYIKHNHSVVSPEKVVFLTKKVIKGDDVKEKDIHYGYIIPFQPALEQVLSCPEVMKCVENPCPVEDGKFSSALDGYFYQNHPTVKAHPKALGIGIYTDGVEPTDTASSKSGVHGVTLIYWSLLNISPKLRSSTKSIFLLGAVNTRVLKRYGYKEMLANFVDIMNKLKKGLLLNINSCKLLFYGVFMFCCGDNPASASIGGFKESHFADHKCRQCLVHTDDIFLHFEEALFPKRSMKTHLDQVKEVEQYKENPKAFDKDPSVTYGINSRSVLMAIEECDVTICLPQDLLHDTIEGTLKIEICCLLKHVLDKKEMSIDVINNRITKFSKYFGVNKPTLITLKHLENKNLRQSAAETLNLAYLLPFALRKFSIVSNQRESASDDANLDCYVLRLQLLDLLMSKVLTIEDVAVIRDVVKKHHTMFQELYPGFETPKLHYEVHFATHILLFGPPSQFWCFRYEAKHAYFKRLFRIKRCLINIVKTFSYSHQRKQGALMLLSAKGNEGPYLSSGNSCGAPKKKLVKALRFQSLVRSAMPDLSSNDSINQYTVCKLNGVKYRQQSAVVIAFHQQVPVFGEVVAIFGHANNVIFILKKLITVAYEKKLHSFRVQYATPIGYEVLKTSNCIHPHHLPYIKTVGGFYITVPCMNFFRTT